MRKILGVFLVLALVMNMQAQELEVRKVQNFNSDWKFELSNNISFKNGDFDDRQWRKLSLPHDWSIEGAYNQNNSGRNAWLPGGIGWYRKHFNLKVEDVNRHIEIQFDGVYRHSQIWVNGQHVGAQYDGYTSFYFDITPFVFFDKPNTIAVKVDNSVQPNCRWYSGSGIYRNTWLRITDQTHIENWGTSITTPNVTKEKAIVQIETTIENFQKRNETVLETIIYDSKGNRVAKEETVVNLNLRKKHKISQKFSVENPSLWSPKSPYLYRVVYRIKENDKVLDDYTDTFGIRTIDFDATKGFFLNGESMKLKGVCLHHEAGDFGAAVPIEIWESRLTVLKDIGCNAIRTAHNVTAPEFMDLCDAMGFMVMDEFVDKWYDNVPYANALKSRSNFFNPSGFGDPNFYLEWKKNYENSVKRDRNHPSVIIWSVGNENHSPGDPRQKAGLRTYASFVRSIDPTRPVISGMERGRDGVPKEKVAAIIDTCEEMDLIALNYGEQWCKAIGKANPGKPYVSTESYVYFNSTPEKRFANLERATWLDVLENEHNMGLFLWVGVDYLGEAKMYPALGTNCGLIDKAGFRKEVSYLYEAFWSEKPMVRIAVYEEDADDFSKSGRWWFPAINEHWNHKKGKSYDVVTYTNCDSVDLYLNGRKIGNKKLADFENWIVKWRDIDFEAGKLKAVGIKKGEEVCEFELKTAGKFRRLSLKSIKKTIHKNEVVEVIVTMEDSKGVKVPVSEEIEFTIEGGAKIRAASNGDMTDLKSASNKTYCKTINGKCKVFFKTGTTLGKIKLMAMTKNGVKASNKFTIEKR